LRLLRYPHRAKKFDNQGQVTFGHLFYRKLRKRGVVSRDFDRSAFKFCFCRNPYDRAVSHYFYVRKKHPDILDPKTTFEEFTKKLGNYGKTFRPQTDWIKGVKIDFIGRFENLNNDLQYVSEVLGVPVRQTPPRNVSNHLPWQQYCDQESMAAIADFYKVDFDTFGYDDNILLGQSAQC